MVCIELRVNYAIYVVLLSDTITLPTMKFEETSTLGLFNVNWTLNGIEKLKEVETKEWANATWTLLLNITAVSYDEMNKTTVFKNIVNLKVYYIL